MGVQTWETDRGIRRRAFANGPVARVVAIPIGERAAVENGGGEDLRLLVSVTPPSFAEILAGRPEAGDKSH